MRASRAGGEGSPQVNELHFSITISAPRAAVWHVLLDDELFGQWTSAFAEGSHYECDWSTGSTIRFLTPGGNGVVAEIVENREHAFLSIRHLGLVLEGVDDLASVEVKAWAPAHENYTLTEVEGGTRLAVNVGVTPPGQEYSEEAWPRALGGVKQLTEGPGTTGPISAPPPSTHPARRRSPRRPLPVARRRSTDLRPAPGAPASPSHAHR